MLAVELISNVIPPLKTSDTVQKALERMSEFKLYHLPIVNETQFLGLVSEDELIELRIRYPTRFHHHPNLIKHLHDLPTLGD